LGAVTGRSSVFGERVPGLPAPGKFVRPGGFALLSRMAAREGLPSVAGLAAKKGKA